MESWHRRQCPVRYPSHHTRWVVICHLAAWDDEVVVMIPELGDGVVCSFTDYILGAIILEHADRDRE